MPELEAAAVDAAAGVLGRVPRARSGRGRSHAHARERDDCANCGARLLGPYCHDCGQLAEDFHRSTWRLIGEVVEGLLHVDSRLWRTLPDLALRPAQLTRAYLDGRRASQIAPLRLFLVVIVALFLLDGLPKSARTHEGALPPNVITFSRGDHAPAAAQGLPHASFKLESLGVRGKWLEDHAERAFAHPEEFKLILESWSERFALLFLPISALLLAALFVFRRQFYFYDHVIFSMHSLSFQALLLIAATLLGRLTDWAGALLLLAPVHLFRHMRGVYGIGVFGALLRMALLGLGSAVALLCLVIGLILIGLTSLAG